MKNYKTFGQTNAAQTEYHRNEPQYTPIDQIAMMDSPPPQHRAIRQLQQHSYDDMNYSSPPMQQMQPPPPPQHQMIQPLSPHELNCSDVMQHIKKCQLCIGLYKCNSNTYLCIIVFLVLLILYLITRIIDK